MTATVKAPSPSLPLKIRPFTPDDYATMSRIHHAIYPEYPESAEEFRYHDENRDPRLTWGRFVAESEGSIVGFGGYGQSSGMYHPQKFHLGIYVQPEYQGKGIGRILYDQISDTLAPLDPIAFRGDARENDERTLRFLADRGFVEEMREQESELDLSRFNPAEWQNSLERVAREGIVIKSYAELAPEDTEAGPKLHELHWQIAQDIPHQDTVTKISYETWAKRFNSPNFIAAGNFIALEGDRYAGTSLLWANKTDANLGTGMTGVLRDYRKRGIATALKVRALTWAKERGTPVVRTANEVNNNGMLGINFRLGFVPTPAWVFLVKTIKDAI